MTRPRRRSREELADEVGQAYGLVVARLPHDEVVRRLMATLGLRETAAKDRVKRAYSRLEEDHAPERALQLQLLKADADADIRRLEEAMVEALEALRAAAGRRQEDDGEESRGSADPYALRDAAASLEKIARAKVDVRNQVAKMNGIFFGRTNVVEASGVTLELHVPMPDGHELPPEAIEAEIVGGELPEAGRGGG